MSFPQVPQNLFSPGIKSMQARVDEKPKKNLVNLTSQKRNTKTELRGGHGEFSLGATDGSIAGALIGEHAKVDGKRKEGNELKPELAVVFHEAESQRKILLEGELFTPRTEEDRWKSERNLSLVNSIVSKMKCITDGIQHGWDSENDGTAACGDTSQSSLGQRDPNVKESSHGVKERAYKDCNMVDGKISEDSMKEYLPTNSADMENIKVGDEVQESEIEIPDVESIGLSATSDEFDGIDLPDENELRSASCDSLESISKFSLEDDEINFESYTD